MQIIITVLALVVIFLLLFVLLIFALFAFDFFLDLPYVAIDRQKIDTIIKLAKIKKGETVVDLGSGDGRLLIAAANAGAHAIGYEINPLLVFLTRLKARLLHLRGGGIATKSGKRHLGGGQVIVKKQNLWQADLSQADVIFVYSLKTHIQKFEDFVYKNAKKGTRIIVNTNPFPSRKPVKSENGIFLYMK